MGISAGSRTLLTSLWTNVLWSSLSWSLASRGCVAVASCSLLLAPLFYSPFLVLSLASHFSICEQHTWHAFVVLVSSPILFLSGAGFLANFWSICSHPLPGHSWYISLKYLFNLAISESLLVSNNLQIGRAHSSAKLKYLAQTRFRGECFMRGCKSPSKTALLMVRVLYLSR